MTAIERQEPLTGDVVGHRVDKTPPARPRRGAKVGRVARGVALAPRELRDWRLVTEMDPDIAAAKASGQIQLLGALRTLQEKTGKERRERMGRVAVEAASAGIPILFGGWIWSTLTLILATAVSLAMLQRKAMYGRVVVRLAEASTISLLLYVILAATLHVHPAIASGGSLRWAWDAAYLLPPTVVLGPVLAWGAWWAWKATADDGTIADNLPSMAASPEQRRERPGPVEAMLATGRLPKGTEPILVGPIVRCNGGAIWTAIVDTLGPSATAFLEDRTRAELASRLGLSTRRIIVTVDEDCGSRLHITGITGQPWRNERHPLMALTPIDVWAGIPHGPTVEGDIVTYRVFERNSLYGGESGAGKSTALAGIWGGFALDPTTSIRVIDGGEADTEQLRASRLADAWTADLDEGAKILTEVLAEIDRRQHLLARSGIRKVSPAFFAEHGIGFILLLIDELATFTQGDDPDGSRKAFGDLLRQILQRARKTGVHVVLSTQSPSVQVIDADARDVISVRWLGRARSNDLGNKVMGKGAVGRGISVATLPNSEDTRGVAWYSAPDREVQMRPWNLTDEDLAALCARGVELRRGVKTVTAADEDKLMAIAVAGLVRERGVTVPAGRVMLARDVATALEMDQSMLRLALGRAGAGTQKVSRPDCPSAHHHAHYVLSDLPATRAL